MGVIGIGWNTESITSQPRWGSTVPTFGSAWCVSRIRDGVLTLRLHPIFYPQTWHAVELAPLVSDHNQALRTGMPSDHLVV